MRPFTDRQIKLLETFASQAVIAIENVRLFQELDERNAELREALEQQTATSEILGVIARSPTDIQSVLDVVAKNAARLCGADDAQILRVEGDVLRRAASYGSRPTSETRPVTREIVAGRAVIDRQTCQVHDIRSAQDQGFRPFAGGFGESRTNLAAPLLRESVSIGAILIRRFQVRPFSDKQMALLTTFADQAVIAIENVRLFNELKESLEQQTATSEILGVIASSPTDIQPVLDVVAENAARVCGAPDAAIYMPVGDLLRKVAGYGSIPGRPIGAEVPLSRNWPPGRVFIDRETIHIDDFVEVASDYPTAGASRQGHRTMLGTPLLREGVPVGVIGVRRMEVRPFTEKEIALLKTFADQAVIAIENVRLFNELKESLEQQTATSEILGVIASSPTDIQPVLDAVAKNAARVCGATDAKIDMHVEGNVLRKVAAYGPVPGSPIGTESLMSEKVQPRESGHY